MPLNIQWNALTYLYGSLTNAGLVNVTGSGQLNLDAGPINNLASGIIDFKTNSTWTGFPATFYNAGFVRKTAGTGTSQIGLSAYPITFINTTGTVEADTGIINFNFGGYTDTSSAHISISLGGATSGTGYGLISFTAPPLLNATLATGTRNGFVPSPGQTFHVLSYPASEPNRFNCLSGLDLGGANICFNHNSVPRELTLLTSRLIQLAPCGHNCSSILRWEAWPLTWLRPAFPVGHCNGPPLNLSSPAWIPVPSACGNEALVPGTPPVYFRLKN